MRMSLVNANNTKDAPQGCMCREGAVHCSVYREQSPPVSARIQASNGCCWLRTAMTGGEIGEEGLVLELGERKREKEGDKGRERECI